MGEEKRILNIDLGDELTTDDELKLYPGYVEVSKQEKLKKDTNYRICKKREADDLEKYLKKMEIEYERKDIDGKAAFKINEGQDKINKLINKVKSNGLER